MPTTSLEIRDALLTAEDALRKVVSLLDLEDARDELAMKQAQECYGVVAGLRRDLESGRWPGRGPVSPSDGSPESHR